MSLSPIAPKPPLRHIAFIMDGNGRWAKQRQLARTEGHKEGVKRIFDVTKRAFEYWNIPYVTLYAFSTENWSRPKYEIDVIFRLLRGWLKRKKSTLLENKIRFRTIGDLSRLPQTAQEILNETIRETSNFTEHTLTVALNYGAREEVLRAARELSPSERENLTWEVLSKHLYTADIPDPDLIVRTSGEQRLSNFLLLQAAYSEFYFTQTYWPDFGADALDEAVENYLRRTRRFGNIEPCLSNV